MRVLFLGDIVGRPGRDAVRLVLPRWRSAYQPDIVVANAENAAAGMGLTPSVAEELLDAGIEVMTLGNHTLSKKETAGLLERESRVLRPANYPPGVPGYGYGVFRAGVGGKLGVISLMGRTFMDPIDDPFQAANALVPLLSAQTPCILVDIHAEATSEKAALAWMLDGRVSAVIGTHTHVPTDDARVLPGGTAFITDVGMVGPRDSVLGVEREIIIRRFLTHMPAKFELADGPVVVSALFVKIDDTTGRAIACERVQDVVTVTRSDSAP